MKNRNTIKFKLLLTGIIVPLFVLPLAAQASFWDDLFDEIDSMITETASSSSSQVVSQLEVKTETGNNVIANNSGGQITEGEQKAEITIEQTVNGQEIEPVYVSTDEGKALVIQETEAEGDEIKTEKQIQTGEEVEETNIEDLSVDDETSVSEETADSQDTDNQDMGNWLEVFFQGLRSVFENLFNFF
jgi:hypothetical protein